MRYSTHVVTCTGSPAVQVHPLVSVGINHEPYSQSRATVIYAFYAVMNRGEMLRHCKISLGCNAECNVVRVTQHKTCSDELNGP